MPSQIAGLAAALSMLVVPSGSGTAPETAASDWVMHGAPARVRTDPLNAIARAEPPSPAPEHAFPVRGHYDWGTAVNGFGGGRGHDGQDIFARCGTRVAAARAGKVVEAATGGAEGNYVVLETADGRQEAYLHLLRRHSVSKGDRLAAGDDVGRVGQTGNAQGCHLHFELWTAPGRRAVAP